MQHKVITVIKREYITRVKTKGFVASVLLMPVMMFIVMLLPSLMVAWQPKSDEIKTFVVFDETGEIFAKMQTAIDENSFFHYKGKRVYQLVEKPSDFNGNAEAKRELNQQVEAKEIRGYIEIPQDVYERLEVNYYAKILQTLRNKSLSGESFRALSPISGLRIKGMLQAKSGTLCDESVLRNTLLLQKQTRAKAQKQARSRAKRRR